MKKTLIISALFLFSFSLFAQDKFTVPEISDASKYARIIVQSNMAMLNSISYARSVGKSLDEYAKFTGDNFKLSWNKENGFDGFVKGTLSNWVCFAIDGGIEILQQSDDFVKFKSTFLFPGLKNAGSLYGITYDEFLDFYDLLHKIIAEYLGAEYTQEIVEDGIIVSIRKK